MVGVGFFKIEILAIKPVFTLFITLATVDVSWLITFIRVEKYAPAQQQKDRRHCYPIFMVRLTRRVSGAGHRVRSTRWLGGYCHLPAEVIKAFL